MVLHLTSKNRNVNGILAQLVRASACHAEGHGFESHRFRNKKISRGLIMRDKTSWKDFFEDAFKTTGDSFETMECTLTEEEMNHAFDSGYGGSEVISN